MYSKLVRTQEYIYEQIWDTTELRSFYYHIVDFLEIPLASLRVKIHVTVICLRSKFFVMILANDTNIQP